MREVRRNKKEQKWADLNGVGISRELRMLHGELHSVKQQQRHLDNRVNCIENRIWKLEHLYNETRVEQAFSK